MALTAKQLEEQKKQAEEILFSGPQALGFAKTSWEEGVAASKELSTARSVQEFFELQTAWAKKSMERYVAELTKTNEIVTATVKDSIKPLNERVTASVETFQAAR